MIKPACARTQARITTVALGAITALLIALSGSASAARPDVFHDRFTASFTDTVCGIDVNVDLRQVDNFMVLADGTVKDTGSGQQTFTNPLNGKAVLLSFAGPAFTPPPVIDDQAGTITFHPTFKGLPEKIQTARGPVLTRDAGIISLAQTFDLNTGEPISQQTTLVKGPHPEAASDFALFCDVVTGALT